MSFSVTPNDLIDHYLSSLVDTNLEKSGEMETQYEKFKGCLSEKVVGTFKRYDGEEEIFEGDQFTNHTLENHFKIIKSAKKLSRDIFEKNDEWICEINSSFIALVGEKEVPGTVIDTVTIKIEKVGNDLKIASVFHNYRPEVEGKKFDYSNDSGDVKIEFKKN